MNMNDNSMVHGLYGSQIKKTKCVAYCCLHKCHLTVSTLKQHECLKKQCNYLKKHIECAYWTEREKIKAIRKERKNKINVSR